MMRRRGWCRFIDHHQSPGQPLSRPPGSFVIYLVWMNWVDKESNMSCVCELSKFLSISYLPPLIYTRTLRPLNIPETAMLLICSEWKLKTEWKIEYWEASGPYPRLSKSRSRFHMAKSLLFSSSPVLENMFTHSYGRNLFNTRTEDPAAPRGPTSPLMRATEAGQKKY